MIWNKELACLIDRNSWRLLFEGDELKQSIHLIRMQYEWKVYGRLPTSPSSRTASSPRAGHIKQFIALPLGDYALHIR